jgi:lathosterol oxidase
MWLRCATVALLVSVVSFYGVGGFVHWLYYVRRRARADEWKLQPRRWLTRDLARHAVLLGGFNLLVGSLLGGTFMWHLGRGGWSTLYRDPGQHGWGWLVVSAVVVFFAIDAGLYYSHRLLHHPRLFPYIHRWHHRYVAPTLFTTTAMHPVEFLIFTAVLAAPAFVIPLHVGVYVAAIAYTYFIGVLDHVGIRAAWRLPLHGDNRFHDDHHVYFHCNYGHHTALFDRLHHTVHVDPKSQEPAHVQLSRAQ